MTNKLAFDFTLRVRDGILTPFEEGSPELEKYLLKAKELIIAELECLPFEPLIHIITTH